MRSLKRRDLDIASHRYIAVIDNLVVLCKGTAYATLQSTKPKLGRSGRFRTNLPSGEHVGCKLRLASNNIEERL
jgi:hypothetical protein